MLALKLDHSVQVYTGTCTTAVIKLSFASLQTPVLFSYVISRANSLVYCKIVLIISFSISVELIPSGVVLMFCCRLFSINSYLNYFQQTSVSVNWADPRLAAKVQTRCCCCLSRFSFVGFFGYFRSDVAQAHQSMGG
jgi:hypothetical protein